MRNRLLTIAAVSLLLMTAAPADAQLAPSVSTPTSLYFHIFDTFNKFPINTQPMQEEFFDVGGTNFPSINHPIGPYGPYDLNTIYGYSTAGPVEYEFMENGRPRFHPERGIAQEVDIDETVTPKVFIYVDVRDAIGGGSTNVLPKFTFEVKMKTGDNPGSTEDLDAGQEIMTGKMTAYLYDGDAESEAALKNTTLSDGTPVLVPDAQGIIEYEIDMEFGDLTKIPKDEAYNIRIDWYQEIDPNSPVCSGDDCAEGFIRLVSNSQHLPRLEMNIMNPIFIEFIHPQVAAGILLIHTGVNSPWGTYDVDIANMTVEVTGPTTPTNLKQVVAQNAHVHGLHDKAAEVTYLWNFREDKAKSGDYDIFVEVASGSTGVKASGNAGFIVKDKEAIGIDEKGQEVEPTVQESNKKDSPGVGLLSVLALLGAALAVWRRKA